MGLDSLNPEMPTFPIKRVRMGVDIGQRVDRTAIVVTEEQDRSGTPFYVSRLVQRLPLGTDYADQIALVTDAYRRLEAHARAHRYAGGVFPVELIMDATGVGLPLADLLRDRGISPTLVTFTSGDTYRQSGNSISIGKGWMVSRLQVLLSMGRLRLPTNDEAAALISELRDYKPTVNERTRNVSFNAKSGSHDDLVIALGLSVGSDNRASIATSHSVFRVSEEEAAIRAMRSRQRAQRS